MIHCTVLCQQLRFAITHIMRMRKAEINQEGILVLVGFAFIQISQNLFGVPGTSSFIGSSAPGSISSHLK